MKAAFWTVFVSVTTVSSRTLVTGIGLILHGCSLLCSGSEIFCRAGHTNLSTFVQKLAFTESKFCVAATYENAMMVLTNYPVESFLN